MASFLTSVVSRTPLNRHLASSRKGVERTRNVRCFAVSTPRKDWTRHPNIDRLDDKILNTCSEREGQAAEMCWAGYQEFQAMVQHAEQTCKTDTKKCNEIERLEALAGMVKGKDGIIGLRKLNDMVMAYQGRYKSAHEAFAATDKDGSGNITKLELHDMITSFGVHVPAEQMDNMFMSMDTDSSGALSIDEFEAFLWQENGLPIHCLDDRDIVGLDGHCGNEDSNTMLHFIGRHDHQQ